MRKEASSHPCRRLLPLWIPRKIRKQAIPVQSARARRWTSQPPRFGALCALVVGVLTAAHRWRDRIRGLPWAATLNDIVKFFEGCRIKDGGVWVTLTRPPSARGESVRHAAACAREATAGEVYVELESEEDTERARLKHK